jgi:hypothetical protein
MSPRGKTGHGARSPLRKGYTIGQPNPAHPFHDVASSQVIHPTVTRPSCQVSPRRAPDVTRAIFAGRIHLASYADKVFGGQ